MLRSMMLGGLDEELTNQVGLFGVSDMPFSWQQQPDSQEDTGEQLAIDEGTEVVMELSPAPATPPISTFTSSLQSPMDGLGSDDLGKYLDPPLPVVDGCAAQGMYLGHAEPSSGGQGIYKKDGQQSMLKVTGLGQLARLIELGCNVGLGNPSTDSRHCSQAGDSRAPAVVGSCDVLARKPEGAEKGAIEIKPLQGSGTPARASSGGRLKLAVRKDTPVIKPVRRASIKRALAAGAPDKRADTLAKLVADEVAPSGRGPRESRWKTGMRLHLNWLPDELYSHSPPTP